MDKNSTICHEIARQEGFHPSVCNIRVTKRQSDGTALQLIFFYPNGQAKFTAVPTIMFGQVEGHFWKKVH